MLSRKTYEGKPCRFGHTERYLNDSKCAVCVRMRLRKRVITDTMREYKKQWRIDHKDLLNARRKEWRKENFHLIEYPRERHRIKAIGDIVKEQKRACQNRHRERYKLTKRIRERQRRAAAGFYSAEDVAAIFSSQGGRCFYCCTDLREQKWEVDHKIPLAKGGTHWPDNLAMACEMCNRAKRVLSVETFAIRLLA